MSSSLDGVYADTESFQETLQQETYQETYDSNYQEATSQEAYDQGGYPAAQETYEQTYQEAVEEKVWDTAGEAATEGGPTIQQRFLDKFGLEWLTIDSLQSWNCLTISLAAVLALILVYILYKVFGPKSKRDRSKEAKKKFKQQQNNSSSETKKSI
jgi:hypothetical protein